MVTFLDVYAHAQTHAFKPEPMGTVLASHTQDFLLAKVKILWQWEPASIVHTLVSLANWVLQGLITELVRAQREISLFQEIGNERSERLLARSSPP